MVGYDTLCRFSKYGVGGIRTHGTLADTLVFKTSLFLVIPIELIVLGETKRPKVDHLLIYVNSSALIAVGKARAASN